jgi:putative ABC transport system permease protein
MRVLDRKMLRELWSMRGQSLAIAMVIASGIAVYIMSVVTLDSLRTTQSTYYRDYGFAEVFASLKRAPASLLERIGDIPGVARVQARVVANVRLEIAGFDDPVTGRLISLPEGRSATLNRLHVTTGSLPEPFAEKQIVISDNFARAHDLEPGDALHAVINGRRERLVIVGAALSPEYVYEIGPGAVFPDWERYGVMWMGERALATAYDMEGAFNDLALTLARGASQQDVIDRLDAILEDYGGLGAYGREDQVSHEYLSQELLGLEAMATVFPIVFLSVAAFLLNVVMSRLIALQREQIGVLKAFGYGHWAIGGHYLRFVTLIVLVGALIGVGLGAWLAQGLSALYTDFYRFPFLRFDMGPHVIATAVLISLAAAGAGTLQAVWRAVRLPPAVAMSPEPPPVYHETLFERTGVKRWLSQPARMILRHLTRRPLKATMSILGIAMAVAVMMVGNFQSDAIDYMINVQFGLSQRDDLMVALNEPRSLRAALEIASLEGVQRVEPYRSAPVRLSAGYRHHRTAIMGIERQSDLYRLLDTGLDLIRLPPGGIVLTEYLAKRLGVGVGEEIDFELLQGERTSGSVPVVGVVTQFIGGGAFMDLDALNRLLREGPVISGVFLTRDATRQPRILEQLNASPLVAGITQRTVAVENFYDTMAETILTFTLINTLLASTIAFGVVYNSARIALSERGRELASLRVLGFNRAEVSYILLGELALLTLAAMPVGFAVGNLICAYIAGQLESELYRIPLVLEPSTYAYAAGTVLVSAVVSGLILWQRIGRLDLVGVLKTRE